MGKNSGIAWTDHTFNPWWGCQKVSDGCVNCYAETLSNRFGEFWGANNPRRFFGDKHWNEPITWNAASGRKGIKERVFCGSMCDWLEERHDSINDDLLENRDCLMLLIEETPNLIWLMLTKRIENLERLIGHRWLKPGGEGIPQNVWIGITAENQKALDMRWPILQELITKYRIDHTFLSLEPLLGPIDLARVCLNIQYDILPVDWIITGAESGIHRREMKPEWEKAIRWQCIENDIPYFCKQMVIDGVMVHLPILDGRTWDQTPEW